MFSKILSRIIFSLLLLTTLTPLIYQKKLFYSYESEKGLFFRFVLEIMLGLWLILIIKEPYFRPRRSPINLSLGFVTLVLIIVDIFSVDIYLSIFSNFERMAGLILYLSVFAYCLIIASILNTSRRWIIFGIMISIVAFIVSIKGIIQSFNAQEMLENGGRIVATIGNPNQLASYLLLGFFIVGILIFEWILPMKKSKKTPSNLLSVLSGIFIFIYGICLLKTSTRGAILGIILGIFLILILTFLKTQKKKLKIIIGTLFSVLILSLIGLFSLRKTDFVKNNSVLNRITVNDGISTFNSRLENYKIAIDGIKAKPFLGWGQETYHYTYAQYFNSKLYNDAPWYDRVHNTILEWMIVGGFLGIIAYLILWTAILYQLWRKDNRINIEVQIIISGFLLAYFVNNLLLFDSLLSLMAFMTVIGFIEKFSSIKEEKEVYVLKNNFVIIESISTIFLMVFIIKITCLDAYKTNKSISNAYNAESLEEVIEIYDKTYQKALIGRQETAEQLANMATEIANSPIRENTKKLYFETTQNILQKELNNHPNYVRLQILYANVLESQNNYSEAIKIHEKVRSFTPKYQRNLTDLGMLLAKNNQYEKGHKILQETLDMEPKNDEAKVNEAIIYAMQNDTLRRNKILSNLSEEALNTYLSKVKYAYGLTNDLDNFINQIQHTSFKSTENLYRQWATSAYSIKNYQESARAVNTYRLHFWGYKFVDNRPISVIYQEVLNGKNPEFTFEKVTE
jgi:O-antigen ligase/tetratricopeptide (TPR) repeat protein